MEMQTFAPRGENIFLIAQRQELHKPPHTWPLKMEKEAGQVFPPPFFLLAENPADLTEGGQPVVCWPSY